MGSGKSTRFSHHVLKYEKPESLLFVSSADEHRSILFEKERKLKSKTSILSKTSTKELDKSYQENINWTRGRFSGETIQIVVRDGKIMEKVFLTPKGNKISVKRSELGLMVR